MEFSVQISMLIRVTI